MLQSEATQAFAKKIEAATFCQLLSHEQISITRKGKDPVSYTSFAVWWLASNEGIGHHSAQVMRRLLTIAYNKYLAESAQDLTLKARIKEQELPSLIIKCFLHFQSLKEKVGPSQNVRNFLDPCFKEAGEATQEEHNPMVAYLEQLQNSGCLGPAEYEVVKKGTGPQTSRCTKFYCDEAEFKLRYKEYCNRNGFDSSEHAYSRALYQSPFGKLNITIKKATYEHWPPYENNGKKVVEGDLKRRSFLYGVWTYGHGLPWDFKDNGFIQ